MIIEDTVENAVVGLLQAGLSQAGLSGVTVLRSMEDFSVSNPLLLPALIVTANMIERIPARNGICRVSVILEYKSIPEENSVNTATTGVQAVMGQVDSLIITQPSSPILAQVPLINGVLFIVWHSLERTQQDVHTDRRTNTRGRTPHRSAGLR